MTVTENPTARVDRLAIALADGTPLLAPVSLDLRPGRVHAVTGPSGAGKTTLLHALAGALPPGARATGLVTVLGQDVLALAPEPLRRLRRHRLAFPGALSGGRQRRVALARALARRPDLLLLDEPGAGLDPALRDEIADLLRELARRHGIAVALASHDAAFVARCADEVLVLAPARPGVGGGAIRAGAIRAGASRTSGPVAARTAVGLAALGVEAHVGYGRGRRRILTGVDLHLAPGSCTGIIGPSGAGKTTLARVLAGLHPPTGGTLTLDGAPLAGSHHARTREQRRRVQLVPQNPLGALNPARTVGATLTRPLRLHHTTPHEQCPGRVAELLAAVGLPADLAARHPHELSDGQRQRVAIARALAAEPDVLLCDEVTSGLDTDTAAGIMTLLGRLRAERGVALALIGHDLSLVREHADAVVQLGAPTGRAWARGPGPARPGAMAPAGSAWVR
ncbi:ABC transporter ATP-binding protein [Kitasatospora sp. NPDC058478]|uniref:ABC transporter ATP-binding protein n=1 Tax=unclassified Kitasatospora TaxID=2633591 RepID=UPI00365FEAC6